MQRLIRRAALLCVLAMSGTALAANTTLVNPKVDTSKTGIAIPNDEQALLERIHQANQREIALGEIAAGRATSASIRNFAKTLVKAQVDADRDVMNYAKSKNIKLGATQPLDDTEAKLLNASKAKFDALAALTGEAFDEAYLTDTIESHDLTLAILLEGQKEFANADVAALFAKLIPTVKTQRAQAYKLLGSAVPKVS